MADVIVGVPLRGMVKERLGHLLQAGEATDLINGWRESGELRPRPGFSPFRDIPATRAIQNLFTCEFADGARALVRLDDRKIYNDGGTTWLSIMGAVPDFTGSPTSPFGIAMVLNELIFSNGVAADGVKRWTGAGNIATIPNAGILVDHDAFRFVAPFASRIIGAHTSGTNGAVTVVGSANGFTTDWTTGNGAFVAVRNEHPSAITGLSSDDNTLIVWKERAIITGVETGDPDSVIAWSLLHTEGVGLIASQSRVSYGGSHWGLSHEGFFSLAGGQLSFIDADIKRDFFSRLTAASLRQVHGMIMPEFGKILWFVPEGGDTYPRAVWVYDLLNGGWDRWTTSRFVSASARALIAVGTQVIDSYSVVPTNIIDTGTESAKIIDSLGTGVTTPAYVIGTDVGATYLIDFGAFTDDGATFGLSWQTPDVRWVGLVDESTGYTITPRDVVVFDEATVEYNHTGPDAVYEVHVSTDGGSTFVLVQTGMLASTTGRYNRLDVAGRVAGDQIRLRIDLPVIVGRTAFRNLMIKGKRVGEHR